MRVKPSFEARNFGTSRAPFRPVARALLAQRCGKLGLSFSCSLFPGFR